MTQMIQTHTQLRSNIYWRQETQIMGFHLKFESLLFGWSGKGTSCMECQISDFVRTSRSNSIATDRICDIYATIEN